MKSFVGKPVNICNKALFINPGTGPVEGASLQNAENNVYQLITDVAGVGPCDIIISRVAEQDGNGRYGFQLQRGECFCSVLMPGLPYASVWYLGLKKQNTWDFPRLYVDGSSWVWKYAINRVQERLGII